MTEIQEQSEPLIVYLRLDDDEVNERIVWLRESLRPGIDWGYCEEYAAIVLLTANAKLLYKITYTDHIRHEIDEFEINRMVNLDAARG